MCSYTTENVSKTRCLVISVQTKGQEVREENKRPGIQKTKGIKSLEQNRKTKEISR